MKIVEEFRDYLQTLGYSEQISYELPNTISRFLIYFKEEKHKSLSKISQKDLEEYIFYIKESISPKTKRKRSIVQINSYIYALKHFSEFLLRVKGQSFSVHHLEYLKGVDRNNRQPLTIEEVKRLFEVTDNTKYGLRDRAMLTLFYSCGLRRNEGIHVETTDIDFRKNLIFVEKGKFGKQRYVPFTESSRQYLYDYIYKARGQFIRKGEKKKRKTLFISNRGLSLDSQSLAIRLKLLSEKAAIQRPFGLHTLRHSIATHLLQKGMSIYSISKFLGHSTLESTQIYTHILENEIIKESLQRET